MMHFRCLCFFLFYVTGGARRSIRIDDSRDDAQQQDNTLANRLEVSAVAREALIPGDFGASFFHRVGLQAGGLRESSKQDGRRAGHLESHRGAPLFRLGPPRAKVALQAASGPEEDRLPPKEVPFSRRSAVLGGSAALAAVLGRVSPGIALDYEPGCGEKCRSSGYGEFAKMSGTMGGDEADAIARNQLGSATGPKSYTQAFSAMSEDERTALLAKAEAVTAKWLKMKAEVAKALSAKTPAYPVAQSALDNSMNAIKTDMRTVSKALSSGDITVRDTTMGGVDQPRFDYNTGQFELQPLAAEAEKVFKVVNDLYFSGIKPKGDPAAALNKLAAADELFVAWRDMVATASSR